MTVFAARRAGRAAAPGSPEWLKLMTASKVSALLGLSPFTSRFTLWHQMNGSLPGDGDSKEKRRGHFLEQGVTDWWASEHPDVKVLETGLWRNRANPRYAATPDRMLTKGRGLWAGFEAKTSATSDENWGKSFSDDYPPYYRAQCLWQCHVIGLPRVHLAALTAYLDFREYVVEPAAGEIDYMIREVEAFLADLDAGIPPSYSDGSDSTYKAMQKLHPDIARKQRAEVHPEIAAAFIATKTDLDLAKARKNAAWTAMADAMGDANYAYCNGHKIARRQAIKDGTPFIVANPALPDPIELFKKQEINA